MSAAGWMLEWSPVGATVTVADIILD